MTTQVYMIMWERIPFLFASKNAAVQSIMATYPEHMVVQSHEREGITTFDVSYEGRVQDRVNVTLYTVNEEPIKIPGRRTSPIEF